MTYAVKEMFYTIQGEGFHAGTAAIFVRFSACNLWSGQDKDRSRDSERSGAICPLWCDTDFVGGSKFTAAELIEKMKETLGLLTSPTRSIPFPSLETIPLIVFTGGEPLLQLDQRLIEAVADAFPNAVQAIETNGTVPPKDGLDLGRLWVCVSPKRPPAQLAIQEGDELKIVVGMCAYEPEEFIEIADEFTHAWVSPVSEENGLGEFGLEPSNMTDAVNFVHVNPEWRISIQTHRVLGIR